MKKSNRFTFSARLLAFLLAVGMLLVCGPAMGQDEDEQEEFILEDVVVTSQFQETQLQKTPIAITAVTGEMLEERNIQGIEDLGLIIPNAAIREQGGMWGPNAYIGMRGVDQGDFIPAFEPGVLVYVDDIINPTVVGSTMDLMDLERVEVLRGPQGTLFGKNAIGGVIRLISKTPQGDNTALLSVEGDRQILQGGVVVLAKVLTGLRPELPLLLPLFGLYVVDLLEAEVGSFSSLLHLSDDFILLIIAAPEEKIAPDCHKDHPHTDDDEQFG